MSVWRPDEKTWASPGSVSRNKGPIADALRRLIEEQQPHTRQVLEVASGFGDHVALFAKHLPEVHFHPTEAQDACIEKLSQLQLSNVSAPGKLNVLDEDDWRAIRAKDVRYDGIVNINMIHISPPESTEALFRHAAELIRPGGFLLLYGAYLRSDGTFASDGDRDFDASLRLRDPSFGLRDPAAVNAIATVHGFAQILSLEMALNNRLFVWRLLEPTSP